jgi:hypothetical protein
LFCAQSYATSLDGYLAPIFSTNVPVYKNEYGLSSPTLNSKLRMGIRFESGRISENISLDARIGFFSSYEDYGLMFRFFQPFNRDGPVTFMLGSGVGISYSPGFDTTALPISGGFTDVLINPFARVVFDLNNEMALMAEAGWLFGVNRSFESVEDRRVKNRVDLAAGLMVSFEELGEYGSLDDVSENSDTVRYKPFLFGFAGGFTGTRVVGGIPSQGSAGGYLGGAAIDFGGPEWGGIVNLLFTQRTLSYSSLKSRANSIEVPAMVRYRIGSPSFMLLTGGGFFHQALSSGAKADYGVTTGLGFGVPSTFALFTLDMRFGFGIADGGSAVINGEKKASHTRTIDVVTGLMF